MVFDKFGLDEMFRFKGGGKGGGGGTYTPEPVNPTPPVEEATLEDVDELDASKDKSKKKLRFNNATLKPKSTDNVGINATRG